MILFPLGHPIFAGLGSAGISIFYVSTIISQLTFSAGSIFKGGVGSELVSHLSSLNPRGDTDFGPPRSKLSPSFTVWP